MPEFIKWIESQKFIRIGRQGAVFQGLPFVGYVHGPIYLNCKVLPRHIKQAIVDKYDNWYKQYDKKWYGLDRIYGVKDFMLDEDKSKHFDEFKSYINKIDNIRGTDFTKTFPELAALI
jgi:hypothetical protein